MTQSWLHLRNAGAGDGTGQDQLRLIDDQTFETLDVMPLQRYEMACSCLSLSFADDPAPYYIVGTAYAIPDEQEPSKVYLAPWQTLQVYMEHLLPRNSRVLLCWMLCVCLTVLHANMVAAQTTLIAAARSVLSLADLLDRDGTRLYCTCTSVVPLYYKHHAHAVYTVLHDCVADRTYVPQSGVVKHIASIEDWCCS